MITCSVRSSTSKFCSVLGVSLLVLGGSAWPAFAQTAESTPPTVHMSQSGRKSRIVFDYSGATPTPTATPSATPEALNRAVPLVTPESTLLTAETLEPTPTPKPQATPIPLPEAAAEPTPESTPAPVAVEEKVAPAMPSIPAVAEATPAATPMAAEVMAAPEPTPEAAEPKVSATAPMPEELVVKTEPGPLPTPPVATPSPTPTPDVVEAATSTDLAPPLPQEPMPRTPTDSVTINLINKLVQRGILTQEDAAEMIKQAEAEAQVVREQMQVDMIAIAQVAAVQAAGEQAVQAAAAAPAVTEEDLRVTYIPAPVKTQIKEDIKLELANEVKAGRISLGPQERLPGWVSRIHPFMDLRLRYEGDFFPAGNDATGAFPNFNAINTGAPYDVTGNQFAPQYNVDQDRNRFRIRVRFGADLELTDHLTMGLRIATGENNSPVTTNQTLGLANQGQGGNFSKYAIWLDRAFLRYDLGEDPNKSASFWLGRFDNPFFYTNMIWDDDLGFDGVAAQIKYEVTDGVVPFLTAGAFPVYNTDFNFSSNQPTKFESYDKYLFGGQLGVDWKINDDWQVKLATAYYYFYNIEGKLSTPYTPQNASDAGDTDASRPSFAQKGNTYMALRNIIPDASNDFGAINQYQYYGLATKFEELAVTGRIDYNGWEPLQVSLIGEFVQNLAFNKGDIEAVAVNNRGANDDDLSDAIGLFDGSPTAWMVELRVGTATFSKAWDWNVGFGYRWIGSDAVVDGFNDSDFGLGGTNMKGYTVGAAVAFSPHVWMALRWMGSDSIAGPQFKTDIIQLDLNSKF